MTLAHDVFSETNPAFCSCVLAAFTAGYLSQKEYGPEMVTAYLALPLALSGDRADTFVGTNKRTGLLEWLERNPQLQVGLAARINASMSIVTDAIRFGCFARVLIVDEDARLTLGAMKLKKRALKLLSDGPAHAIKHAERLGHWFAMAGSTRSIFDMMSLRV